MIAWMCKLVTKYSLPYEITYEKHDHLSNKKEYIQACDCVPLAMKVNRFLKLNIEGNLVFHFLSKQVKDNQI